MKSVFRLWNGKLWKAKVWSMAIASGLWLLFSQPAHADDVRNCHLLPSSDLHPSAIVASLPKTNITQLKISFLDDHLERSAPQHDGYFKRSERSSLEYWESAIAANPGNATAWNNLGQVLFVAKQYTGALMAYDHALVINPSYSLVLANRCGILSQLEEYTQALASCDLALKGDGHWSPQGSALAWNNRGDVLFNLEEYQASLQSFEQALIVNPDYQDAWYNRAIVLARLESIEDR